MNWTKQTYLNTSALTEQKQENIKEIVYSFDGKEKSRVASFFSGKGEVAVEIEILTSQQVIASIFVNDIFAGEFGMQKFALSIFLNEGINSIRVDTDVIDNGMIARIKGVKLERIYNPLKVIGSTEFGEGCLLYTLENNEVYQKLIGSNGDISTSKMTGYKYFDSKNFYEEKDTYRLVSLGIDGSDEMMYFDKAEVINLAKADKAVLVEQPLGGVYIFFTYKSQLYLIYVDKTQNIHEFGVIAKSIEDIFAATSGSILLYKQKSKWWSAEIVSQGATVLTAGNEVLHLKKNSLNTVNLPNATKDGSYYICRGGNMYKYHNNEKEILAYCELYIPFKGGGIMIWSKKLYVYLNDK